jgi:signal transduction histidine kinase
MQLSIRVRTILALNVFVLGLALALGWIAQEVAGQVVEERFAKEMANGVSGFLKDKSLPLNDTMMAYLRDMFHAQWLTSRTTVTNIVASSLPRELTREFRSQVDGFKRAGVIQLGGESYRVDWADVPLTNPETGRADSCRLFMLVPNAQFQEARDKASAGVLKVMLPSVAVATVLAILLAFTITRPLRKLAGEMDRLATDDGGMVTSVNHAKDARATKGPMEIVRLAASFHQLLDRLAAARGRLAQHERLATLGKVCLSVAHELRNPLSGIKMHARLLKDSVDKSSADSLEIMLREIDRMELYLDELMSLSVSDDPAQRELNLAPTKLSELAQGVLAILAGRCRHAKIAVVTEFPPDEPAIPADPGQLRQVMMNLMVNAIQAMPSGGTMTVRVCSMGILPMSVSVVSSSVSSISSSEAQQQLPPPQQQQDMAKMAMLHTTADSLLFQVADTGKGVTEPERDIFEAFVSDKPNGVGLGLYLCKQIVTRHGGSIGYDNSANGATFWFELPLGKKRND